MTPEDEAHVRRIVDAIEKQFGVKIEVENRHVVAPGSTIGAWVQIAPDEDGRKHTILLPCGCPVGSHAFHGLLTEPDGEQKRIILPSEFGGVMLESMKTQAEQN